jgi:hypothetical protein
VENIGARRLQTVMERVLDEISFAAADRTGETIRIDAAYVMARIGDLAKNTDLSKFILSAGPSAATGGAPRGRRCRPATGTPMPKARAAPRGVGPAPW